MRATCPDNPVILDLIGLPKRTNYEIPQHAIVSDLFLDSFLSYNYEHNPKIYVLQQAVLKLRSSYWVTQDF